MKIFHTMTNQEVREALSHVHLIAHVHFVEMQGDELARSFQVPARVTVNRLVDSLPYGAPNGQCWIKGDLGLEPVVGVLIDSSGVSVLLDRSQGAP